MLDFLADGPAVTGIESVDGSIYRRSLPLPFGAAVVWLRPDPDHVRAVAPRRPPGPSRRGAAVPAAPRSRRRPGRGRRVPRSGPAARAAGAQAPGPPGPGHGDGFELLVRRDRRPAGLGRRRPHGPRPARRRLGEPLLAPEEGIGSHFPTADALAEAPDEALPAREPSGHDPAGCRRGRERRARRDPGVDRDEVRARLLAMPGVGPWTADYVALRALRRPRRLAAHRPDPASLRRAAPCRPRAVAALAGLRRGPPLDPRRPGGLMSTYLDVRGSDDCRHPRRGCPGQPPGVGPLVVIARAASS